MPDREFKVTIIKIFTGLDKRVEDISVILNKEREKKRTNHWAPGGLKLVECMTLDLGLWV